jgi:hypothetical protein
MGAFNADVAAGGVGGSVGSGSGSDLMAVAAAEGNTGGVSFLEASPAFSSLTTVASDVADNSANDFFGPRAPNPVDVPLKAPKPPETGAAPFGGGCEKVGFMLPPRAEGAPKADFIPPPRAEGAPKAGVAVALFEAKADFIPPPRAEVAPKAGDDDAVDEDPG